MFLNRRAFAQAMLLSAAHVKISRAQGFAGLGIEQGAFEPVTPGKEIIFPADHGAHPNFRIEWWYATANLRDGTGRSYGVQWTLFRQATTPGSDDVGWSNRQIWMAHAAVTSSNEHHFSERLARGGIGQAGVDAKPFHAWIDAWNMRGNNGGSDQSLSPLLLSASASDFSFELNLQTQRPIVLQGDAGYSRKSNNGQASYYYSQPFFEARGSIELGGRTIQVTGQAWMDREWSSQPLASDQKGWDWISLHLDSRKKLMVFRLRQSNGVNFMSGNWIDADGRSHELAADAIAMTPTAQTLVEGRKLPTTWDIAIPSRGVRITTIPLHAQSWMATTIPYWEGPISAQGSHAGVGYLEMTGY